ncbi:tRNA (carboxymethyluridine(34)-5-O)-methyltransferase [Phoenix dactylifera]|uniref:tRNA (Carboxymethyluridine(34)-5-O)-methyltransferase n=1 Tax=Phoenix dactylifera TaxID=42345 RepID=A0A8B7CKG7_PHODC|nr:tRNA (carboxymethyluridine(34)-5-O)-methyltransferase [Phoenix dactylifera]XP_008801010.2 tRNA (carboxymethyluridine(34)-5-O)-methyltransferase [Phoenix dactylifera]
MVLSVLRVARYFHEVLEVSIHPLDAKKFCSKEVLQVSPSIGFLVPIYTYSMSTSQSLICVQGFHSGTSLSSINSNGKPESKESMSSCEDRTCSLSVQSTPDIEKKYVHRVYDAIAPHFSATRFAKWPKVAEFLNSLRPGSIILDAGCGNGKYLGFNPNCFDIGCDISPHLIDICARRGHEVMVADAVNLPYRDNFGDAAISIAVLHHLSTEMRRRKAIEELIRAVGKGGLVLITVWAREQEDKSLLTKWTPLCHKYDEEWISPSSSPLRNSSTMKLESIPEADENCHRGAKESNHVHNQTTEDEQESKDAAVVASVSPGISEDCLSTSIDQNEAQQEYFVPWHLPYHRAEISGASASALASGLAKKDDKKGAMVYNRYYHVFVEGELQSLVSGIDNAVIVDQFYDKSNWCIVLEKL